MAPKEAEPRWAEDQFSHENRKTCLTFASIGAAGTLFTEKVHMSLRGDVSCETAACFVHSEPRERNAQMCHEHRVSSKAPSLHHVVAAISHLRCQGPHPVSGLWVQSGDGTPDGDVQWPYGEAWNPEHRRYLRSYF